MFDILKIFLKKMSSKTAARKALTKRIKSSTKVPKLNETVSDIEDASNVLHSTPAQYFSPIQTRQKSKMKAAKLTKLETPSRDVGTNGQIEKCDVASCSTKVETLATTSEKINEKWQPDHWMEVLRNIRLMRKGGKAPVDTMGCHKCSDETADEKTKRFHTLVALMLSSQTKDETTFEAMLRLREHTLTPQKLVDMDRSVLQSVLYPVSFYKNKAKYLQETSRILIEKYDSDIPKTVKELVSLPGVGPKMAHICMSTAWDEVTGIGVDVHVHRIANRLGWVPQVTKEPEQTRVALEAWLPRELWSEITYLLVGFGQTQCTPVRPHCASCLNRMICPSASKNSHKISSSPTTEDENDFLSTIKKAKFQKKKIHL